MNIFGLTVPTLDEVSSWWADFGYLVLVASLVVVAGLAVVSLVAAHRRNESTRWFITVTTLAIQAFSLEGMWEVVVNNLGIDPWLAACVFFGLEAAIVVFCAYAAENYKATAVFDEDGKLVKPGNPGWQGGMVWGLAAFVGLVVMINSLVFAETAWRGIVEGILRLSLPVLAAALWWSRSIRHGVTRKRSSWRWTPERLLVRIGAKEPGEADLQSAPRRYLVRQMVINAARVHSGGRRAGRGEKRLRKLARDADETVIAEVAEQVARVQRIKDLTDPAKVEGYESRIRDLEDQLTAKDTKHEAELERLLSDSEAAAEQGRSRLQVQLEQAGEVIEELRRSHAEQVAELESQIARIRAEAAEQVRALRGELAELRPAAEQAAVLSRQVEAFQAGGRNGSRANGSAEQVPTQRRETRSPDPAPTASASTSGSLALDLHPTMTAKEQLHVAWDALAADGVVNGDTKTPTLVELGLRQVEVEVSRDSASRYARDWAREVREGRRTAAPASGRKLRAVPHPTDQD